MFAIRLLTAVAILCLGGCAREEKAMDGPRASDSWVGEGLSLVAIATSDVVGYRVSLLPRLGAGGNVTRRPGRKFVANWGICYNPSYDWESIQLAKDRVSPDFTSLVLIDFPL